MTIAAKRWGLIFIALFCFGFTGQEIELEQYFNARYSANFLKSTNNVKFVMPPGTKGRIQETKKFYSGNYGLRVELTSGPHKGEKVWVYYDPENPRMKLYPSAEAEAHEKPTQEVEKAEKIKTTETVEALRAPASEPATTSREAANMVRQLQGANDLVQKTLPCDDCEVKNNYSTALSKNESVPGDRDYQDPPILRSPTRTENPHKDSRAILRQVGPYGEGTLLGQSKPSRFYFQNNGPNKVVMKPGASVYRSWEFYHPGDARQDLRFTVTDSPSATNSHLQNSYMMVFPRKTLPHIRVEGQKQIVTLPTGETVTFDVRTKEILNGVMSEGPLSPATKSERPPSVTYNGTGVLVRVDKRADDPRRAAAKVMISKQGRTCTVPRKDLWPDQRESSSFHFKFFSDQDFDRYLKQKCGFGL